MDFFKFAQPVEKGINAKIKAKGWGKVDVTSTAIPAYLNTPVHRTGEYDRWLDIGFTSKSRLVVVWYTERNNRIRIIGCRKATRDERSCYKK